MGVAANNNASLSVPAVEQPIDFRPCPFCAHEKPVVVTIAGDPPVYIVACPECDASGPKQLPGVTVGTAVDAWNRRYGMHRRPLLWRRGLQSHCIVESFYPASTAGRHGPIHVRPARDQVFSQELFVQCSRELIDPSLSPVGTKS